MRFFSPFLKTPEPAPERARAARQSSTDPEPKPFNGQPPLIARESSVGSDCFEGLECELDVAKHHGPYGHSCPAPTLLARGVPTVSKQRSQKEAATWATGREKPKSSAVAWADDYDWTVGIDEDDPWRRKPDEFSGARVHGDHGTLKYLPRIAHTEQKLEREHCERSKRHVAFYKSPELCPICACPADEVPVFASFSCNEHAACGSCIALYLRGQLGEGKVPRCMEPGCQAIAGPQLVQALLGHSEFQKYLVLALKAECYVHDCPMCDQLVCVNDLEPPAMGGPGNTSANGAFRSVAIRCASCKHRFCAACALEWHPRSNCDEARQRVRRRNQREASGKFAKLAMELGLKDCPQCHTPCEKSDPDACDHMTCVNCTFEFCWSCLADRSVVYAHGNHFHYKDCRFHSPYDGEKEFLPERCVRCKKFGLACTPPPQGTADS